MNHKEATNKKAPEKIEQYQTLTGKVSSMFKKKNLIFINNTRFKFQ
jgi:hypothetical protein